MTIFTKNIYIKKKSCFHTKKIKYIWLDMSTYLFSNFVNKKGEIFWNHLQDWKYNIFVYHNLSIKYNKMQYNALKREVKKM